MTLCDNTDQPQHKKRKQEQGLSPHSNPYKEETQFQLPTHNNHLNQESKSRRLPTRQRQGSKHKSVKSVNATKKQFGLLTNAALPQNSVLGASFQLAFDSSNPLPSSSANCAQAPLVHSTTRSLIPSKRTIKTMLEYNKQPAQSSSAQDTNADNGPVPIAVAASAGIAHSRPIETDDVDMPQSLMPPPLMGPDSLTHPDVMAHIRINPIHASANSHMLSRSHVHNIDLPQEEQNSLDNVQDDELATVQRLYDVTIESPRSPGSAFKRMRSCADSDAGSSSCKDMDEPEVLAPDSVPALIAQLRQLLNYVASKPTLQNGSASFMRDYLRTMLIQNSVAAEEAIQTANKLHKAEGSSVRRKTNECFRKIPDELAKHIFSFLDGHNLARAREVCRRWNDFACDEQLWKALCLKRWRSLDIDKEIWKLIDRAVDLEGPTRWRQIYPKVNKTPQWKCRLQKTGRFICNLVAHQLSGTALGDAGLPNILVVERRFNILHLQTFVLPEASVLYYEPENESDRAGFEEFIEYLHKRTRAGLALEDQRRFIFIPPCEYTRNQVDYQGKSLLGVVQNAYPPLAP